jgi:hypothetical protein
MESYKCALKTDYTVEPNVTKYTYDEAMNLLKTMNIKSVVDLSSANLSEEAVDFICEQNDSINYIFLHLKAEYESFGFLNTLTFRDFNEIILQNVQVDVIVEDHEDNELSFDDEEW